MYEITSHLKQSGQNIHFFFHLFPYRISAKGAKTLLQVTSNLSFDDDCRQCYPSGLSNFNC